MSRALADNVTEIAAEDFKTRSKALQRRNGIALQSEYRTDLIGNCIEAVSKVACSIRTQGEK